jgi:hypothetical protein
MHTQKRYSNVAFTKRVDYDGGAHRGEKAAKGPLVCSTCGSVYVRRRWIQRADSRAEVIGLFAASTICPACDMQAKGQVGGFLRLEGAFLAGHRMELRRLLMNEAKRAAEDNPLARIIKWDESVPGVLTLSTTTEHLVERLGHALKRAFDGTIDYGFSHGNKFARAVWRRD